MNSKKVIKEVNKILDQEKLVHAARIEAFQLPHNYKPNADIIILGLSLWKIHKYEKENGSSCIYRDERGRKCVLMVDDHIQHNGLVLTIRNSITAEQLANEVAKIEETLDKYGIHHIAVGKGE